MSAIGVLRPASVVAGLLALVAVAALAVSDARAASPAESFVQTNIERTYAILNDDTLDASQRREQFRAFLHSIVDIDRVALFTLGPYARNAPPGDLDTFERSFTDFLTVVYQRGLETYSSPKVTGSTERAPDDVIVNVAARMTNGNQPSTLAFRVRGPSGGNQLVTDIQVEGAWLAITQRGDFTAYLQQHGGNLSALAAELDKRTEHLRLAQSESDIRRRDR